MANTKPLSLRRQRGAKTSRSVGSSTATLQAEVLVDTGIYHLSEPYSYLVPASLNGIVVGSVVTVPFNSTNTIGVILSIGPIASAGLKSIQGLASEFVIPPALQQLALAMTKSYVCTLFEAYKFILPPLSKNVSILLKTREADQRNRNPKTYSVISQIGENIEDLLLERIRRSSDARRICIVPTLRDLEHLAARLRSHKISFVEYGSHLSLAQRRAVHTALSQGSATLVVGTRSAIFAPLTPLDEIVVIGEDSQHMYEQKVPYWSIREIASIRSTLQGAHLYFVSPSPSTDVMHSALSGEIEFARKRPLVGIRNRFRVSCSPHNYLEIIRRAVKSGSVLVTVAEKGFSNLFVCRRCRNVARCNCGGRISIAHRDSFVCGLCAHTSQSWICNECSSQDYVMLRTGSKKILEELGKSLPGTKIFLSTAEKPIEYIEDQFCVVVSTSGMEPRVNSGFSAIVLLNGEELLSRPYVRAEEEVLHRWFQSLQRIKRGGEIFVSLPAAHRISQSIITGDSAKFIKREVDERRILGLPPTRDVIVIESRTEALSSLRAKLVKQYPSCVVNLSPNSRRISLVAEKELRVEIVASLRALLKIRSINKKNSLRVSINPYNF